MRYSVNSLIVARLHIARVVTIFVLQTKLYGNIVDVWEGLSL
jgi:hypothetical protein